MESSVLSSKFLSSCRHCRPFQTQWEVCGVDVLVTSLPLHRLPLQLNQLIGVTLQYSGSYATQDLWDTRQWIFFSAQPYSKESKLFQGFYINYDLLMMSQKEAPRKHPMVLTSIHFCVVEYNGCFLNVSYYIPAAAEVGTQEVSVIWKFTQNRLLFQEAPIDVY